MISKRKRQVMYVVFNAQVIIKTPQLCNVLYYNITAVKQITV